MINIGIDFSLNSPGVTIEYDDRIKFFSFFNTEGYEWDRPNPLKKFTHHNAIRDFVTVVPYTRTKTDKKTPYADEQMAKMKDASMMTELIMKTISENIHGDKIMFSLEGFAYQSSGASFIDLILFNSFLRKGIIEKWGYDKLMIIAPSAAKKLAGKGNADKEYMINAFRNNVLEDEKLAVTGLYEYANAITDFKNVKPVDDIVDSYFIMKSQNTRK